MTGTTFPLHRLARFVCSSAYHDLHVLSVLEIHTLERVLGMSYQIIELSMHSIQQVSSSNPLHPRVCLCWYGTKASMFRIP